VGHARLTGHRPVATADDLSGIEVPVATAPAGVQSRGTRSSDRPQAGGYNAPQLIRPAVLIFRHVLV